MCSVLVGWIKDVTKGKSVQIGKQHYSWLLQ